MLTQTNAIILNRKKYSDSSIIVQCLSEKLGKQSVLVYGIGGKKNNKISLFQPLFIHDMQLYTKPNREIQKLKETKLSPPLFKISENLQKQTIALFLSEIISKSITEKHADENVFNFIKTSILFLDELEKGLSIFHLFFLLHLAKYLGIVPDLSINNKFIDLQKGYGTSEKPHHDNYLNKDIANIWASIIKTNYTDIEFVKINKHDRMKSLELLIKLYEIHILNFGSIKSYDVLREIFKK